MTWQPLEEAQMTNTPFPNLTADLMKDAKIYMNDLYTVIVRKQADGGYVLSIRANDRSPRHNWWEFQRIKNELTDSECEAIELYPAESRLVDTVNQYWLWVFSKGMRLPVGFQERLTGQETDVSVLAKEKELESSQRVLLNEIPTIIDARVQSLVKEVLDNYGFSAAPGRSLTDGLRIVFTRLLSQTTGR